MSQQHSVRTAPQQAMLTRLRRRLGLSGLSVLTMASGPCGGCIDDGPAFEHCSSLDDLRLTREAVLVQSQEAPGGDSCAPSGEPSIGGGGAASEGGTGFAGAFCEMAGAPSSDPAGLTPEARENLQELALAWQELDLCPEPASYDALQVLTNPEYRAADKRVVRRIESESGQCCYEANIHRECNGGRPFLVQGAARLARLNLGGEQSSDGAEGELAIGLRDAWAQDARSEHASVAAFARLALQLMHLGAPLNLVIEAQRASIDEARHARLCLVQSRSYGTGAVELGALDVSGALDDLSVRELFVTNLIEGCIGETLAAARARVQAGYADDWELKTELESLAADEENHAALAWSILGWLLSGDERMKLIGLAREVVRAHRPRQAGQQEEAEVDERWRRAGRLPLSEALQVDYQTWALTVSPLLDEMLRGAGVSAAAESHSFV